MKLLVSEELMAQIRGHGEKTYPNEGAGFLLGTYQGSTRTVCVVLPMNNEKDGVEARNRYMIRPEEMLGAEKEAASRGLDLIGVFHSHPDHPEQPSQTDLESALPWLSYLITSVQAGRAAGSNSWRLADDRSHFEEEKIEEQT